MNGVRNGQGNPWTVVDAKVRPVRVYALSEVRAGQEFYARDAEHPSIEYLCVAHRAITIGEALELVQP